MKRLLFLPIITTLFIACQQPPTLVQQPKAIGTLEVSFDLDAKTAQVSRVANRSVLTPSQVSFTKPNSLSFLADATTGTNYIGATFGVNNLTNNPITDLTIVAYQQTGNAADTALKSITDFNSIPLTATQLQTFARSVQPTNFPSAVSPLTTNNTLADLQLFQESELGSLETAANSAGEINTAGGEYLFPYGFVARSSSTSRTLAANSTNNQVTISIRIPNNNEPSVANARRFVMTFAVFDQPLGAGVKRMSESYEERHGTSAATRASSFGIASTAIAQLTSSSVSSGILVNGVRTAGSSSNVQRILGERSWQFGTTASEYAYGVATDPSGNVYLTGGIESGSLDGVTTGGLVDLILVKYNASGVRQWIRQLGINPSNGTTDNVYGWSIAADSSGNTYITGAVNGDLDGAGPEASAGGDDVIVIKYDTNGTKQWAHQFGSNSTDFGDSITVDSSSNVYITGLTNGDIDGAGPEVYAGNGDTFVTKYNSSGVRQWIKEFGTSTSSDIGAGVGVDFGGNVYVSGYSGGNFDGNTSAGSYDNFVIKFNSSGTKQWSRLLGTTGNETAYGIAVDANGNSYTTGTTTGSLDGNVNPQVGNQDLYLIKYDSNGNKQWTRQFGASAQDYASEVALDSTGNVYISGYVLAAVDGNFFAGNQDIVIVKYDTNGIKKWSKLLGTSDYDSTGDMAIEPNGDVYLGTQTTTGWGGVTHLGSSSASDILLLRVSSN